MQKKLTLFLAVFCLLPFFASISGAFATWFFAEDPSSSVTETGRISMSEFQYKPFEGVYIDTIVVYDFRSVTERALEISFPTDLYSSVRASAGGYITYKITFHNNSSVNQWFIKQSYDSNLANNSLIETTNGISIATKDHPADSVSTFDASDYIPANTYRDVYVTYSFGSASTGEIVTFVDYLFGEKLDAVYTSFSDVLNAPETYALLTQALNDSYSKTGNVAISNVGDDKALFDQIFGESITVNIDGNELPATITIRRENVDGKVTGDSYSGSGPSGCEYVLYITVDELDPNNNPTGNATVYAIAYSNGGISNQDEWYQIGELYEGTAPLVNVNGNNVFDYTNWEASPKEYVVADGITYKIGLEQGDQYQKMKTLEELMAVKDNEIFNKINNTQILKKVYAIVYNPQNEGKPGYDILKQAFLDAAPFYTVNNNGGDIPVNTNCTRAEILPYIEAIQKALDYYNQVN